MEKEIFELIYDENNELPMDYVALVDYPAIESNWMAFSKQEKKMQFQIKNEEKRIVSGYAMKADLPIPRIDEHGKEFFVVFRKKTIEGLVNRFMKQGANSNTNLMHDDKKRLEGVFIFESLLIDQDRGIKAPEGFEDAPDGSWWISMRVQDDKVWEEVKAGTFRGFSIEVEAKPDRTASVEEQQIQQIRDIINQL